MVPGTRSAFAERAVSGYYLDIDIDRAAAARHGLNVGDVQTVIATAVGGMTITQTVEGRERYGVRVRYPQELRDTPERLASVLVPVAHGGRGRTAGDGMAAWRRRRRRQLAGEAYVPLGQVATIRQVAGPMVVRTEDAMPTAWVYVDVAGRDIGSYVAEAQAMVERDGDAPAGVPLVWSGQYEYMQRAAAKLQAGHSRDARDHLPAALPQFQERGRDADRDAVAPVRAGRRHLVHLAARLQLVGRRGDRVHRARRRGGGDRGGDAASIWIRPGRRQRARGAGRRCEVCTRRSWRARWSGCARR